MDGLKAYAESKGCNQTVIFVRLWADHASAMPEELPKFIRWLREARGKRLMKWGVEKLVRNPDDPEALEMIDEARRETEEADHVSLLDRLESIRYDPDKPPPPDEVCLKFLGVPVGARGNISAIQAKIKSGKTAVSASCIAAAIRGDYQAQGDMLGFEWVGEASGAILHFDTEQSPADHHACVERARKRAGVANADRLHSYPLMTFKTRERMEVLYQKVKCLASRGKIDLILIDGGADFLANVNDIEMANDLVAEWGRIAHEHDCAIIVVIHENPGTDNGKTRGHLGSELQRKAFANIRIDKDPETNVSTIYGTDWRKGAIPKKQGLCFAWDNKQGMHITLGIHGQITGQAREMAKADKEREKWREIFDNVTNEDGTKPVCPELHPEQAAKIIQDINGTEKREKADTIKKQMQRAETLGVLRKAGRSTWQIIQTGQTGQNRDKKEMS